MADFDYDLFVIGGGSGGVRAARMAAQAGARVGITESSRYGGTCVIRGCVPKKLMVFASNFPKAAAEAEGYGWRFDAIDHDWPAFQQKRATEITRLENAYRSTLQNAGCDVFDCRGTLADPHTVRLHDPDGGTREVSAKHILIATGGHPRVPDIPGAEHAIVSDDIFDIAERPKRAIIIGGGYIAAEFAGILHGLGVQTMLAYRGELFLRGFDREVRELVAGQMRANGIDMRFDLDIARIDRDGDIRRVTFQGGETAEAEVVLLATGRLPNTHGLGLEQAGVRLRHNGPVEVDAYSQTSVPSVYAVGDVTGRLELTPVAIREGAAFVETVFHGNPTSFDHELVPTAIFTQPEIGTIGSAEDACHAEGRPVDVYVADFRSMYHAFAGSDERTLMKLIVDRPSGRICGCHIVGKGAGEMIQMVGIAIRMGATKQDFDRTCAVHPTSAEEIVTMREPVRRHHTGQEQTGQEQTGQEQTGGQPAAADASSQS